MMYKLKMLTIPEFIITLLTTRFLHKKYGQYKHESLDKFTSQYSYTNYYKYLSLNKKKKKKNIILKVMQQL